MDTEEVWEYPDDPEDGGELKSVSAAAILWRLCWSIR